MNLKKILIILIIGSTFFFSCQEDYESPDEDILVVEAYLFMGESLNHFRLSKAIKYEDDNSEEQEPIKDALVKISIGNIDYYLTSLNDSGYYSLSDTNFIIQENFECSFEFEYSGNTLSAETTVPSKPIDFSTSQSSIEVEKIEEGETPDIDVEILDVTWENLDNSYYYLKIENIESDPEFVNYMLEEMASESDRDFSVTTTTPTTGSSFKINSMSDLFYFGTHRIVLYHINEEYVSLFENTSNSTTSISEPETNIVNGKGIFTGIATDTLYLEVIEK